MATMNPAMSDARAFTSYVSNGLAEETLQRRLGVRSETEYRRYLQHNAVAVANMLRGAAPAGASGATMAVPPPRRAR